MTNQLTSFRDSSESTSSSRSSSGTSSEVSRMLTDFTKNMETTIKKTPRLPTAEEFLANFENAFNTVLSDLGSFGSGGLGPNEAEFARNVLMPALFSEYQARLGDIARTGQSPFRTAYGGASKQTSRSNIGQSSQTTGTRDSRSDQSGSQNQSGSSVSTTVNPDGTVSTTYGNNSSGGGYSDNESTRGNIDNVENQSGVINENQTIEEDILLPKLMPEDFLKQVLTTGNVKGAYEGSRRGAGQFQSSGTGTTIARRI